MHRRDLLKSGCLAGLAGALPSNLLAAQGASDPETPTGREFWLQQMLRIAHPPLDALSRGQLRLTMPIECAPGMEESRRRTTYLEAFGRLLCGIGPWLEHGPAAGAEGTLRSTYLDLVDKALAHGVDPNSPDYLQFGSDQQTIVDASFLALAVLRAPQTLNAALGSGVRKQLADGFRATRPLLAGFNNWLLFAAAIEAALFALGEPWDKVRVDYALREHESWYVGDGLYGDGPHFHLDYYNSFVIHPFLLAILDALGNEQPAWKAMGPAIRQRAARYAHSQERLIAPDGSYPIVGRSITYRCGAFHLLADVALRRTLPADLDPGQVRCALASVIHRTITPAGTFDSGGWLRIGLAGHQPSLGERYISTGSLYLCAAAFLPLGLPQEDAFWSAPDTPWSSQKLWSGTDLPADHALDI